MLVRTPFLAPRFPEFAQFQQALHSLIEPSLLAGTPVNASVPTVKVRSHADHVELTVLAAGLDPASIDVTFEQGVLSVSGERAADATAKEAGVTVHVQERFTGRINRRLRLPDDIDPQGITARYVDGALHIRVQRRAAQAPRRIAVQ